VSPSSPKGIFLAQGHNLVVCGLEDIALASDKWF
jgi:hypothetical protein